MRRHKIFMVSVMLVVLLWMSYALYMATLLPEISITKDIFWNDDLEADKEPYVYQFCSYTSYFPGIWISNTSIKCLPPGTATVVPGDHLGGLILEYLSLWTAARLYNLSAFIPRTLRETLEVVFEPPLGLPEMSEFVSQFRCPQDALGDAEKHLFKIDQRQMPLEKVAAVAKQMFFPIVFEMYINLPETIVPLATEVRLHLRYRQKLQRYVDNKLHQLRMAVMSEDPHIKALVFAGVHVRRTDYAYHVRDLYKSSRTADEKFYGKAALWLSDKVVPPGGELVLVVASDDPEWVQGVLMPHLRSLGLRHSYFAGDSDLKSPERDLALLSACNHSVFAYGTFGLWSALAAGGRTAVFHLNHGDAVSPAMQFAQHMPGWVAIK